MDHSLPGSLEWDFPGKNTGVVAISSSQGSSWWRDQTHISWFAGKVFTAEPSGKAEDDIMVSVTVILGHDCWGPDVFLFW